MIIFAVFNNERIKLQVCETDRVEDVKERVRDAFCIGPDGSSISSSSECEKKSLILKFCGSELKSEWLIMNLGIVAGSTLKALLKDEIEPRLYIYCVFNEKIIEILESIDFSETTVRELRGIVSRKSGLPVSVFRLTTITGLELFDCQLLSSYGIKKAHRLKLETWDGWNDLLIKSKVGFTSQVIDCLFKDDVVARFQMKVSLYIAAHFGNVDLAVTLLRHGVRSDEAVGEHPLRQWCKGEESHIDALKSPIHEATECGQLSVLRSFVNHSVISVLAKDGNGLTALNIALRKKQKACASFLLTQQWKKIDFTKKKTIPLAIYTKMKKWSERAKTKTLVIHGQYKSSIKNPRRHLAQGALVGHGLQLDGFGESKQSTKALSLVKMEEEEEEKRRKRLYGIEPKANQMDPECYFKSLGTISLFKPKQKLGLGKWGKLLTKASTMRKLSNDDSAEIDQSASNLAVITPENKANISLKLPLPPIKEQLKKKKSNLSEKSVVQEPLVINQKSFFLQTGKTLKAMSSPVSTSLPEMSTDKNVTRDDDTLKKTNKVKKLSPLDLKKTVQMFHIERGINGRQFAKKCLSVATSFEKPWLQQVRLAMQISQSSVKKVLDKKPHMFSIEQTSTSSA